MYVNVKYGQQMRQVLLYGDVSVRSALEKARDTDGLPLPKNLNKLIIMLNDKAVSLTAWVIGDGEYVATRQK